MTPGLIHFAAPIWLVVGLVVGAALSLLELRLERQRRKALLTFSSRGPALASSLSRWWRFTKAALRVVGVMALCCALGRPQYGFRAEETYRRGLDLMFVLDTSKSMLTPDLKPNRLARAKLALYDLVSKFDGDRVGLVAFAGDAFLECPLTLDHGMFEQTLDAVDTTTIPRGGTDLGRAVNVAVEALHSQPANRKLLVLLTDGEDLESGAIAAARAAAGAGVRIYAVGVGTGGGELIPLPGGGFVKDSSGAFVHSRLDEHTLTKTAGVTGGQYRALGADGGGLELLYQDVLEKLPQDTFGERMHRVPLERFQWPLGLAAFCLAAEALLQERRRRRAARVAGAGSARPFRGGVLPGAVGLVVATFASGTARASVTQAEQDYRSGRFPQAADEYRRASEQHPDDPRLRLNAGAATYRNGDYAGASDAFKSALHSDRLDLQQRAYYDLGNSLYRTGEQSLKAEPGQTIQRWKEAIISYEGALKLNPSDDDATFNRDLVKKKLADLERQQSQKDRSKQSDQQEKSGQDIHDQKQAGQDQDQKDGGQDKSGQKQAGHGQQDRKRTEQGQQGQKQAREGQQNQKQAGQGEQDQKQLQSPAAQDAEQAPESEPKPGQLSKADARGLLDSLRGDEQVMHAAGVENVRRTDDEPTAKDW